MISLRALKWESTEFHQEIISCIASNRRWSMKNSSRATTTRYAGKGISSVISWVMIDRRGRLPPPAYIIRACIYLPLYLYTRTRTFHLHTSRCYEGIRMREGMAQCGATRAQLNKWSTWRGFVTRFSDNEILAGAVLCSQACGRARCIRACVSRDNWSVENNSAKATFDKIR